MKINDREYRYIIEPRFGKVTAEIYKVEKSIMGFEHHIHLIDKEFGKWHRKPVKEDYVKARKWAEEQMQCIYHANKDLI